MDGTSPNARTSDEQPDGDMLSGCVLCWTYGYVWMYNTKVVHITEKILIKLNHTISVVGGLLEGARGVTDCPRGCVEDTRA